jgi:hypothetical protein
MCLICQNEFSNKSGLDVITLLGHAVEGKNLEKAHSFHATCLYDWLSHQLKDKCLYSGSVQDPLSYFKEIYTCPTCRNPIDFKKEKIL